MQGSKVRIGAAAIAALVATSGAQAADDGNFFTEFFSGISVGGFLQVETAFRTTSEENLNNQRGNPFNGRPTPRLGLPVQVNNTVGAITDALSGINLGLGDTLIPGVLNQLDTLVGNTGLADTVTRSVPPADNSFNLTIVRTEVDLEWPITNNVRLKATARGIFDVDRYENFDDELDTPANAGFPANTPGILQNPNGVNFFEYRYDSNIPDTYTSLDQTNEEIRNGLQAEEGSSPLEFAGQDYLVDFPNLYLDISLGSLLLRVGNQQIAWGDAIFFRILDVPNALDFRRHSLLDFVAEEFSDKRVPALGVRASYTGPNPFFLRGEWEYDAFVQRFRSNILGNPNTPYNIIPSQFTVHDKFKAVDNEYNYGIRLKGPAGPVDLQFIAARVYNPAGVFHWTANGIEDDGQILPGTGNGLLPPGTEFSGGLARTALSADPTGVVSAEEFSFYGGNVRLDHFNGLNELIENFPAAQGLFAARAESNRAQLRQEDLFFQLTGGLRGHVARDYFRENNFGFGATHRFSASPGSIFDQLIGSIEFKYVPDRVYTPVDLSPERDEFIQEDEIEAALVFTKFQRFTRGFPATFLVLQYLYRSESDLFGRHLSGYGGARNKFSGNTNFPDDIGMEDPDATGVGRDNYQALAFAFQQPFPSRIFVADFAMLYDIEGGLLLQPSLTWKPNGEFKVQAFYNFIDTVHGEPNNNAIDTATFADELTLRLSYQF